jgi:hypothetical protein
MRKINSIIDSVLKETIKERAKKITKTIKESIDAVCEECGSYMTEGECLECGMKGSYEESYEMMEDEDMGGGNDYVMDKIERECKDDPQSASCIKHKEYAGISTDGEMTEKLHGKQRNLDVAEPKGKLTSADFKKLRGMKNKKSEENENWGAVARVAAPMVASYIGSKLGENEEELDEEFFYSDEQDAERLSKEEPTYVGRGLKDNKMKADMKNKMYGSFSDIHGWYDDSDREFRGEFEDDYDEETFDDFKTFNKKYAGKQRWFSPGKQGEEFFNKYKEQYGSPFRVRKYKSVDEAETEEGNAFTGALAKARKSGDDEFEVDGKKYNTKESVKSKLTLTENELIELIESIVIEEEKKKVLDKKKPKGYTEFEKNVKLSKKENDDYIKSVTKKLKDYLKDGSKDDFSLDPKHFPKGNGQLEKMKKKAYTPSEAVEEYIEEFAYSPGMENLQYDEVKPNDEWIEMNLEGSSKTGNSSDYANAEKTELGKKINEKRKKNLYGIEKRKSSYKRVKQTIDSAGEGKGEKSIKNMFKKLEENIGTKENELIKEEFNKISNLISYNRKTQ